MFKYNMKLWMGVVVIALLAEGFAFTSPAQEGRLKSLEDQMNYVVEQHRCSIKMV